MFSVCLCVCVLTALVSPNVQLLGKLRYHQESPPALPLLGFQNVSKNVVTNVNNVLSFDAQQIAHNVRRTCKNKRRQAVAIIGGCAEERHDGFRHGGWTSGKEESPNFNTIPNEINS